MTDAKIFFDQLHGQGFFQRVYEAQCVDECNARVLLPSIIAISLDRLLLERPTPDGQMFDTFVHLVGQSHNDWDDMRDARDTLWEIAANKDCCAVPLILERDGNLHPKLSYGDDFFKSMGFSLHYENDFCPVDCNMDTVQRSWMVGMYVANLIREQSVRELIVLIGENHLADIENAIRVCLHYIDYGSPSFTVYASKNKTKSLGVSTLFTIDTMSEYKRFLMEDLPRLYASQYPSAQQNPAERLFNILRDKFKNDSSYRSDWSFSFYQAIASSVKNSNCNKENEIIAKIGEVNDVLELAAYFGIENVVTGNNLPSADESGEVEFEVGIVAPPVNLINQRGVDQVEDSSSDGEYEVSGLWTSDDESEDGTAPSLTK